MQQRNPMSNLSDLELLGELGVELEVEKPRTYSPLEARLIAGFEDILKFTEENGRPPEHGEERDIFERLYAVRLDQLRKNLQAHALLEDIDTYGLLSLKNDDQVAEHDDDALLSTLGVSSDISDDSDITKIKHVAPMAHRRAAEEIANREICRDFQKFAPLFKKVEEEIKMGIRKVRKFRKGAGFLKADITRGQFVIIGGQSAFIAEIGDPQKAPNGENDSRLRVIYSNGTESDILLRSLIRAMYKDETSRIISDIASGPLFSDIEDEDTETGTIYVLKSKSDLPEILPIRDAIVKIGVTGGSVKSRISNAKKEATYLLGDVEIIDEYTLYNVSRKKLENLIHQIFSDAQLQITIQDRFGKPFTPREWFLVPPNAVAEAVELIRSGDITRFKYDRKTAKFVAVNRATK